MVFEKKRKRLVFVLFLGVVFMMILSFYIISLDVFALSAFLFIPWVLLVRFYRHWGRLFAAGFKPLVVSSLLDFIDSKLRYYHKEYISKDTFLRSGIFPINPDVYKGEDYIMGKIGDIFFEMCELEIYYTSGIQGELEHWFGGIFFHANFNTNFKGRIVMIPRRDWQRFIPVMKSFTRYGGHELHETGNEVFDEEFLVYMDKNIHYKDILTPKLLEAVNGYHLRSGKRVYASFYNSHFYLAIEEPYELLEASMWHANMNFEMIQSYYQELRLFTRIVEDFDVTH